MSQDQPSETVGRALDALARGSFEPKDLHPLSDLSRAARRAFDAAWLDLPEAARIAAIKAMATEAAESFELNFQRALDSAIRRDPSAVVRQLAVLASNERDDADFAELMLELVRNDPSVDVRAAAASALGVICDLAVSGDAGALGGVAERARQALIRILENQSEHPLVRGKALESVAAFGSQPAVVAAIDAARQSDDESLRASSLIAMGRTCGRRWLGDILGALRSEDVALRRAAAIACGRLGEADAIVSLGSVARDSDREVRNAAIWSIGEIGGGAAANVLAKLLKDANKDERALIEAAIEEANLGDATGDAWW